MDSKKKSTSKKSRQILEQLLQTEEHKDIEPKNGEESWNRLILGNQRFMNGDIISFMMNLSHEISPETRIKLTTGQKPHTTVITCSDSRVSPELIFDEGLGNLFIIRLAGNVVDDIAMGSIEYGVHHLGTPLLLIMGHQNCGAVVATKSTGGKFDENGEKSHVTQILKKIWPSCEKCLNKNDNEKVQLDEMIQLNVKNTKQQILKSEEIKELVEENKLKIIMAEYYMDSGKVVELRYDERSNHICFGDVVTLKNSSSNTFLGVNENNEPCMLNASNEENEKEKTLWILRNSFEDSHFCIGNPISEGHTIRFENVFTKQILHFQNSSNKDDKKSKNEFSLSNEINENSDFKLNMKIEEEKENYSLCTQQLFSLQLLNTEVFLSNKSNKLKTNKNREEQTFWVIEEISKFAGN